MAIMTEKQIKDTYGKQYDDAKAKGDSAGMIAANKAANAVRANQGQVSQVANVDIANVANKTNTSKSAITNSNNNMSANAIKNAAVSSNNNKVKNLPYTGGTPKVENLPYKGDTPKVENYNNTTNKVPASAQAISYALKPQDVAKYSNNYMTEINRRNTLQGTLTNDKDKTENQAAIQALINARSGKIDADSSLSDYKYQNIGETWDLDKQISGGKNTGVKGYAANAIAGNKSVVPVATVPSTTIPAPVDRWSLITNNQRGNSNMITDASGKQFTLSQRAIDENGIEAYIDENGNHIDRENTSNKKNPSNSNNSSNSTSTNATQTNYRKLAEQALKPQFDKAVDQQMEEFTKQMISRGFFGQLPAEQMKAEIMSNMQADYQSQVSALAMQLEDKDTANDRYEQQFDYQAGRDAINDARYEDTTNYNRNMQQEDRDIAAENRVRSSLAGASEQEWIQYERDQQQKMDALEYQMKELEIRARIETDPMKLEQAKIALQQAKLNMEETQANINYIKTQKGKSSGGSGGSSTATKENQANLIKKWQSWAFSGKTNEEGLQAIRQSKSLIIADIGLAEYNKIEASLLGSPGGDEKAW